jgi:hypothetical protein
MNYYVTTTTDLLTPEQRKQFNDIIDVCHDSDFVSRLWDCLDHKVTDTVAEYGTEMENFKGDLADFCFGWVMGVKMMGIEAKIAHHNLKDK